MSHFLEIDQFGCAKIKSNSAHFTDYLALARQCIECFVRIIFGPAQITSEIISSGYSSDVICPILSPVSISEGSFLGCMCITASVSV